MGLGIVDVQPTPAKAVGSLRSGGLDGLASGTACQGSATQRADAQDVRAGVLPLLPRDRFQALRWGGATDGSRRGRSVGSRQGAATHGRLLADRVLSQPGESRVSRVNGTGSEVPALGIPG